MNPPVRVAPVHHSQLETAFSVCRGITRKSAKNFYYGFLVLPRYKRDALSSVYAFMRRCDDLADEPGLAPEQRLARLEEWRAAMRRALSGVPTDEPVLMALADTVARFKIPPQLLDQLVQGTAMDAGQHEQPRSSMPQVSYRSFDELYSYCYHVASVVGLICIRIFGFRDNAAEKLAEHCGVAFQLTNIIRDVKEDAGMGRVYLPEEDLAQFGCSAAELNNGVDRARLRPVLEFEAERARGYYRSAEQLLPLIEDDSRACLWVLVTIYRRLLEKIASRGFDVFGEKVRLSTAEKLAVVSRGLLRRLTG